MTILNFCTNFFQTNAYFGGYPSKIEFNELVNEIKIEHFIDFTTIKERQHLRYNYQYDLNKYSYIRYINFCILDNKIPTCTESFFKLLIETSELIRQGKRIYIHCKGGHGRSTLFVACLLMYLHSYNIEKSLIHTRKFHQERKNLKEKYRDIDVPQSTCQRNYIETIYEKLQIK